MANYVYIDQIEKQYVYPYTVPVFQGRIEGPASRFQYMDKIYNEHLSKEHYFCDYTKYLPPFDTFGVNLKPNCFITATGMSLCREDKRECLSKKMKE